MKIVLLYIAKIIDIFFSMALSFFLLPMCALIKLSSKIHGDKSKVIFIASGEPIKPNTIDNQKYQKEWNEYFQRQFLSFYNKKSFVFYSGDESSLYKLTNKVIGIVSKKIGKRKVFFQKTIASINFIKDFFSILKIVKKLNIGVIACYCPSDRMLLAGLLRSALSVKLYASVMGNGDLAWSEHPYKNKRIKALLLHIYEKAIAFFFFRQADLVLAYNNHIGDYALSNGAAVEKIRRTRIYPCITTFEKKDLILKQDLENFPKTRKNIMIWSRFSYEKKIPYALNGALKALEADKDLGLILVGYGPMFNEIETSVKNSNVSQRVSMFNFMPSFKLLSYLYYADVALIPLGGFSMLEACLLEKPIVCFDIEWHHELLTDGYSGYFADYPNSQMVCDRILEAISDPDEAKLRAKRAHERYKLLFDTDRIQARENEIFERWDT